MQILVTGGAGYIGSHTLIELLEHNYRLVVIDNFVNSHLEALRRVQEVTGRSLTLVEGDINDAAKLDAVFSEHSIDAVIHFAGLKAVSESVLQPLPYYRNNVAGTVTLCEAMARAGVHRLVFSSSATVYGESAPVPYHEALPRGRVAQPYGSTKAVAEQLLEDLCRADPRWSVVLLRYFNPIGAHQSGQIGEDPLGTPNNLMPYVVQVAAQRLERLSIFGCDYPTLDGTCVRDYLHVMDLAEGHRRALDCLAAPGCFAYNLGAGRGYSVLEVVETFIQTNDVPVPYQFVPRRLGDLPAFWANTDKAERELGWRARREIYPPC
ncbi:UDP-glucose 4-epimerase GalE [Salinicola tamaricis]|uniref:UDP-glucose 4-epimerase GalE n=1 Tax=Salinicola tamaricis TaxID=1771309 RepID=UPI0030F3A2EB